MKESYLPVLRPVLVLSLAVICTVLAGCVMSKKTHREIVRTISLADFAGTYKNQSDPKHGYRGFTLTNIIWPKHPPAVSSGIGDYRGIDRVKVAVDGRKVTLTFLTWGKVFDQVTYEEGKDFRLSGSLVNLKMESGAAATLGKGGEEMAGMVPVPPGAGAIAQWGKLFLNQKGDIVVRMDSTAAMLVFFVAPVVLSEGSDTIFERVNEEQDRLAGYGGPRSYEPLISNIYEMQRNIQDTLKRSQNAICIASIGPTQQFTVRKSANSFVFEIRLTLRGEVPSKANRVPVAARNQTDLPLKAELPISGAPGIVYWLRGRPVKFHEQEYRVDLEEKLVGQERMLVIDLGDDAQLAHDLVTHLIESVFIDAKYQGRHHLKITYWD